jgi:chromosome segregation ATPase
MWVWRRRVSSDAGRVPEASRPELDGERLKLAEALRSLSEQVDQVAQGLRRLEAISQERSAADGVRHQLRDAWDDLDECQAECERLAGECERLRASLDESNRSLAAARETIRAMEATRGWRLLVWFRRVRDRLFGRV